MYEQFISGKSGKPMVDILNTKEFSTGLLCRFLKEDESFSQIEKKKLITPEEKILEIYNAIFVNKYSGNDYQKTIGNVSLMLIQENLSWWQQVCYLNMRITKYKGISIR